MRRSFSRVIILNDWEDGRHRRAFSFFVFERNHSKLVKHRKNSQSAATLQMKKWQIALEMPLCQQTGTSADAEVFYFEVRKRHLPNEDTFKLG